MDVRVSWTLAYARELPSIKLKELYILQLINYVTEIINLMKIHY